MSLFRAGLSSFIMCSALCFGAAAAPVNDIGALSVAGNQIRGANGEVAQLRGMSLYWSQAKAGRDFYNAGVVNWLADDWRANIIRAAMAIEGDWSVVEKGYLSDRDGNKNRVKAVVDAAIAKGIYVIIDWHDHNATSHQSEAVSFFSEMAQTYGSYPNVIYEIFNEPVDQSWNDIKNYSIAVINAIRQNDPDNIIVVGTPKWSSEVAEASRSPITGKTNIAYTFHFYASEKWHYNHYMNKADSALQNGIALFVTEWGNSEASGNGNLNTEYMNAFMNWMEGKKLSWCNWSISDLTETSSALKAGSWDAQGNIVHSVSTTGGWSTSDLTASGIYTREKMIAYNRAWSPVVTIREPSTKASLSSGMDLRIITTGAGAGLKLDAGHCWSVAELFDPAGRRVWSRAVLPGKSQIVKLPGSRAAGTDVIRLTGDKGRVTAPVIIGR